MKTRTNAALISVLGLVLAAGTAQAQDSKPAPGTLQPTTIVQPPAVAPAPAPAAAGASQLVFETMEHDFTRIPDTKSVEFDFKFVNKGTGVLRFTQEPHPSCGCTAGKPRSAKSPDKDQMEFAAGEEGYLKVTYNPQGKHGDANQRVTLYTNDPQQPEQIIKIHAYVKTTVSFDPPLISFGDVRAGEASKQIVKVNGPLPDFKATYASISKGRYITVKVLDTKPANVDGEDVSQTTMELTFNGNAPRGTLQAVTTVRTNNDAFPLADLQVMAEVVGDLQVLPPRVNVGIIDVGQAFSKTFRVSSRTGKPFHITHTEQKSSMQEPLVVTVTPVEPGNESAYTVEVKGQGPAMASPLQATITLTTDNAADKTLEVALNGAVRPPQTPVPAAPGGVGPVINPSGPATDTPKPVKN